MMTNLPGFRPRRPHALTGPSAASLVYQLANRDTVDPIDAARILELELAHVEQVSACRREYQFRPSGLWADATAIVGGRDGAWRVLDLVPRDLSLAALRLDPAHEIRPHLKHTNDGAIVVALEHHFAVRAGTLIVRTRGQSLRLDRVTLTTG